MVPGRFGCSSALLAIRATLAPSRAARRAIANPTPRLPPDMKIVLPSRGVELLPVATHLLLPFHKSIKPCFHSLLPLRSALIGVLFPLLAQGLVGVLFGNDHGADGFDPLLVRKSYDRDLGDRLVVVEGVLHVAPGYLH